MEKKGIQTNIGSLNRDIKAANSLMQSIRQMVRHLKGWIADLKEKKAVLLEALEQAKEPTLPELLFRYLEQRSGERADWTSRGKLKGTVADYNKVQAAMDFLRKKGISTVESLDTRLDGISQTAVSVMGSMKKSEKRIKAINTMLSYIDKYEANKPVHAEYAAIGWKKKKEKFAESHREELDAYNAAIRYFSPAENYISDDGIAIESNSMIIQFASYLDSVFDSPIDFENDVPISAVLYDGMSRTKYLKRSGRSRYTKMLANDMEEFYRSMGICSIASMSQVQRALLRDYYDFSVICQIAFFLRMEIEELTNPFLTTKQIQQEQESHYMRNAAPVDWELLDAETAPVLEKFAKGVYDGTANENGRPERVSEKLVYREIGLLGHQLENMPRCKAVFDRYTESYPESWARKIIWAYHKLKEEGETFYWTDIRRIAGVKKKNVPLIVPYLMKHTDVDTIGQIIRLIVVNNK